MDHTAISHQRLTVNVSTGCEGPRHDPYSYTETEVVVPGATVLLHEGLGTWMKVNGEKVEAPKDLSHDEREKWLREEAFPDATGFTKAQLERIANRLSSRCRKCGGKSFHTESGYPGEHFDVCDSCGHIQNTSFSISDVE